MNRTGNEGESAARLAAGRPPGLRFAARSITPSVGRNAHQMQPSGEAGLARSVGGSSTINNAEIRLLAVRSVDRPLISQSVDDVPGTASAWESVMQRLNVILNVKPGRRKSALLS